MKGKPSIIGRRVSTFNRKKLKSLIEESGMRQYEFSEEIGVSDSALCHWLKGKTNPSIESLMKICKFFDVGIAEMTTENEDEKADNLEAVKSLEAVKAVKKDCSMLRELLESAISSMKNCDDPCEFCAHEEEHDGERSCRLKGCSWKWKLSTLADYVLKESH